MSQTNWEADKMLDVYIHDYFLKRDLKASAQAFRTEGKVSSDPVAIDAPGGFLFEWWSVFWDIFIARTNEKHSEVAASYIKAQSMKAREQQQQQPQLQQPQPPQQQQQMHMQQLLLQRQAQQQRHQQQQQQQHEDGHLMSGASNGTVGNDSLVRQNPGTANALATKMYEEKLKLPVQRDSLDEATMKQRFGDNVSPLLDPNHASILKSAAASGHPSGQVPLGSSGGMSPHVQARSHQFPGSIPDIKTEMNPIPNPKAVGPEGSLIGNTGSSQGGNNLTLKGWPLTMLTPQHQQQLLLAQQNLASASANDVEGRRLRMLLNNQNLSMVKDGISNSIGDVVPNIGSPLQSGGPVLSGADPEILMKLRLVQLQQQQQQENQQQQSSNQSQQQQQIQQHVLASPQPQSSNHNLQQEKVMGTGSVAGDSGMSNSFHGGDQTGRKRKLPVSSSGPANSSGTANTAGPSPSSAPSTPSTHTAGDVMSMSRAALPHGASSSKPMVTFGSDNRGTLKSPSEQLWDDKDLVRGDVDRFVDDVEDNVESFLSHDDADTRDTVGRGMDFSKGK